MNRPSLLFWILLAALFAVQLVVPSSMIMKQKQVQREGTTFLFELDAIDPTDPFRGSYIILNPKENFIKLRSFDPSNSIDNYAYFENNTQGYAEIAGLSSERPQHSDYLKVEASGRFYKMDSIYKVRIGYPFERYYVNENIAEDAEKLIRKVLRDSSQTSYAEVKILDGYHSLIDVKVNGKSLNQLISK